MGVALGLSLAAVVTLAGPVWPHLFTQDDEVLGAVALLMPLVAGMLPLNAIVYVLDGESSHPAGLCQGSFAAPLSRCRGLFTEH